MDDFNNFFDDQRNTQPEHTPVYHTPSPKNNNKLGPVGIMCVVIAVVMCIVVLVNVIVLASLKQTIAEEYASSISASMQKQYREAIDEALKGTNIVGDITDAATQKALEALKTNVGQVANSKSASVARLTMYDTSSGSGGTATGFLITDKTTDSPYRYVLTNAHCVRYEKPYKISYLSPTEIKWATYNYITCSFDGDTTNYKLEVVAYGAYKGKQLSAESNQPDIAILRIVGIVSNSTVAEGQPSYDSLKIASANATRGMAVALIGNPEGVGTTNSISTGVISQTGITISGWGSGKFVMTDAAVNGGNSGGPMIDILGNVVGIVESKLVDESIDNMGFGLDVSTIRNFIDWASKADNNLLNQNLNLTL